MSQHLIDEARRRILIIDGAMGTMIQNERLDEDGYRGVSGGEAVDLGTDLPQAGNNDLLVLTQPAIVQKIHEQYLRAGADIVGTNTFSSTTIAQADYGLQHKVYDLNVAGARVARAAADAVTAEQPDRPRFVAGAIGPTNRTLSISPDVNDPGYRAVSFQEMAAAYAEAARGLIDGGADFILIETIFDTLNAKAAIFGVEGLFAEGVKRLPLMISGTITDRSGRTLSGQTPTAFWNSVRHANPLSVGLNCALGAEEMRQHAAELAAVADTLICVYPNAGLPNEMGAYDESPDYMGDQLEEFAKGGLLNIVGGCCGTTPEHIRAIADKVAGFAPRKPVGAQADPAAFGAGAVRADEGSAVRQRRRAHQRHGLGQVPQADQGRRLLDRARRRARAGGERRADHRRQHGRGAARVEGGHGDLPQARRLRARHRARAGDGRQLQVGRDRGGSAPGPGQGRGQLDLHEGGRGGLPAPGRAGAPLRRRRRGDGVRREGPGRHLRAQDRDLRPGLQAPHRERLPAGGHHLRPQHLRGGDGDRGAQQLRQRLHQRDALDPREPAARARLGRCVQPLLLVPRQRPGARGDALGVPVPRHPGGDGHGHRQRRPACRLRRPQPRAARAVRGRGPQPARGFHRAPAGGRRTLQGRRRRQAGGRPLVARDGRRGPPAGTRWSTASPSSSRRMWRRRARRPSARSTSSKGR